MDDKISIFLVVILAIGGLTMVTILLACYACVFRDLCCRPENRSKKRRQQNSQRECNNPNKARLDTIPLNDYTQGNSILTESERV